MQREESISHLSFGDRLRLVRHKHNWTQEELVGKIGVDTATVKRWESGKSLPRADAQRKLSGHSDKTLMNCSTPSKVKV